MVNVLDSPDPFVALRWGVFAVIDFPISLLYMFAGKGYLDWSDSFVGSNSIFALLLYPPHPIHGVLGTIWWYFLPRLLTPKKFGGVWGKRVAVEHQQA